MTKKQTKQNKLNNRQKTFCKIGRCLMFAAFAHCVLKTQVLNFQHQLKHCGICQCDIWPALKHLERCL